MIFINFSYKLIGILILVSFSTLTYGQYSWVKYYDSPDSSRFIIDIEPTQDGGYYIAASLSWSNAPGHYDNNPLLIRVDSDGDVIWERQYPSLNRSFKEVEELPNGGAMLLLGGHQNSMGELAGTDVMTTTSTGAIDWTQTYISSPGMSHISFSMFGEGIESTNDGNFLVIDYNGSALKITPSGTELWRTETILGDYPLIISNLGDNIVDIGNDNFVLVGRENNSGASNLMAKIINDTGVVASVELDSMDTKGIAVIRTSDQALLFVGNPDYSVNDTLTLIKTDDNLNTLWRKKHLLPIPYSHHSTIDVWNIQEADNGEIWCLVGGTSGHNGNPEFAWIYVFDPGGNYVKTILASDALNFSGVDHYAYPQSIGVRLGNPPAELLKSVNNELTIGLTAYHYNPTTYTKLRESIVFAKLDSSGAIYSTLDGFVYADYNNDCNYNTGDLPFDQVIVEAQRVSDGFTFYGVSDTNGYYSLFVDTGSYTITSHLPYPIYWQACTNTTSVVFNGQNRQTVDLGMEEIVHCPLLSIDLSAPYLRATGGGSAYTISVCNTGSANSTNTLVEIDFDPRLNISSSSIPIVNQVGNQYHFNIGNVDVGACMQFSVQVIADTTVLPHQTLCTEAYVYPDSICIPNYWSGPIIDVDGSCINDTVFFEISNKGSSMGSTLEYYVFEDHVMMRQGTFQLGNGTTKLIAQEALPGRTYRLSAKQEVGFPPLLGDILATDVVEACVLNSNGTFNSGFVNQFSNGHSNPFIAIDCQPIRSAYDPNDKSAQPIGYQSQHYIDTNTTIDYKVRFQNTGNDTAFYVMIKDTLSPYLNPGSLIMGASSHPYTWQILNGNILKVTFFHIKLVDSLTNEPLSHGFFRYSIRQKPNNPVGTVINNSAAIYFDYNPPIITNTTFHTISESFITINLTTEKLYQDAVQVMVYPNPFKEQTTLEVEGKEYETLTLQVYDLSGRLVQTLGARHSSTIKIDRQNLIQGVYIYKLKGNGAPISTGKLVIQAH